MAAKMLSEDIYCWFEVRGNENSQHCTKVESMGLGDLAEAAEKFAIILAMHSGRDIVDWFKGHKYVVDMRTSKEGPVVKSFGFVVSAKMDVSVFDPEDASTGK